MADALIEVGLLTKIQHKSKEDTAMLLVRRLSLIMLFAVTIHANAAPVWNPNNGHIYEAINVSGGINWFDAKGAAMAMALTGFQGHLATIASQSENDFIAQNLPKRGYWIDGFQNTNSPTYIEPDGGWEWTTGEPFTYTNWRRGEPNNFHGSNPNEDGIEFFYGTWNDLSRNFKRDGYIVEYDIEGSLSALKIETIDMLETWFKTPMLIGIIGTEEVDIPSSEAAWASSDSTVALIDKQGHIIAVAPGEATITATYKGIQASTTVTVSNGSRSSDPGDIYIGWITRLPEIEYIWGSTNPAVEGWPTVEQQVTWQAHVKNWSRIDRKGVGYRWLMDGVEMASGTIDMPAFSTITLDYPWTWTFNRHELMLEVDPDDRILEAEEANNELSIFTDAITIGFYVEERQYNFFREHQHKLGVNANNWEDWAQRQVNRWNEMFANAIYPETPLGVLDRIRLDKVTIVPDNALPLAGGQPTVHPNMNDRTVDLQWGFPSSRIYEDLTTAEDRNPFYFAGPLFHELGHARYLIDVYGFAVNHNETEGVFILEDGEPIVGTDYMPFLSWDIVRFSLWDGLMTGNYALIDRYSAIALNLIAGHRATCGNFNAPCNVGIFLQDLPAENRLTVTDETGNVLPNANLRIYRATSSGEVWYGQHFDSVPDLELTTDQNGQVLLGQNPFSQDGAIVHTFGFTNGVVIIRVEHEGNVGYTFLDVSLFNMEYWRGNSQMGNYEISVKWGKTSNSN